MMHQFSSPTELISGLHFDRLLVPGSWVWCQIPALNERHPQWRLGRILSLALPGSFSVDVLVPRDTLSSPTPEKPSSVTDEAVLVPRCMVIPRSAIIPFDSAGYRSQGSLAFTLQPKLSLSPAILDDLSFLFLSHPVSFASLLCDRLSQGIFHTSIGPQVGIVMNPFKSIQEDPSIVMRYWTQMTSKLDPHALLIARKAYERLKYSIRSCPSQSIVLIGPPGGGRAHSASRIVQFLASCSIVGKPTLGFKLEESKSKEQIIISQVQAATSVLLAFTQRCRDFFPSASFAGLVFNVAYDSETRKHLRSIKTGIWATDVSPITSYLRHPNERLPHVFYYFLISAVAFEEQSHEALEFVSPFDALAVLRFLPRPVPDDKAFHVDNFRSIVSSLTVLGYSASERSELFRALFVVAMSDAAYTSRIRGRQSELSEGLTEGGVAAAMSKLLGLPDMTLEVQEVMDSRSEVLCLLSIFLYERILDSVIDKINLVLSNELDVQLIERLSRSEERQRDQNLIETQMKTSSQPTISVIYGPGFVHDSSSLVDLLRNASEDVLLNWVTSELLENTRRQYFAEGVTVGEVEGWTDATDVNQLFMRPKNGVFALLDQMDLTFRRAEKGFFARLQKQKTREIRRMSLGGEEGIQDVEQPAARDPYRASYWAQLGETFLKELEAGQSDVKKSSMRVLMTKPTNPLQFAVRHVVRSAAYSASQFASDNSATRVPPKLDNLLRRSESPFIESLFGQELRITTSVIPGDSIARFSSRSSRVHQAIEDLSFWVSQTAPNFFIFCLTPNLVGQPQYGDVNHVIQMLQQYQLVPFCQMQQSMFSIQIPFELFVDNFLNLLFLEGRELNKYYLIKNDSNKRRGARNLLEVLRVPNDEYWIGHHYVFLQKKAGILMEKRKNELDDRLSSIIHLQRLWPGFVPRLQFVRQRQRTIRIQAHCRRLLSRKSERERQENSNLIFGLVVLLKSLLVKVLTSSFDRELEAARRMQREETTAYQTIAAIQVQSWWRKKRAMRHAEHLRLMKLQGNAIINIQNICRRYVAQVHLLRQITVRQREGQKVVLIQSHIRRWKDRKALLRLLCLRSAILPIKRISSTVIALKHRIHMLKVLSNHHECRRAVGEKRKLDFFALKIQTLWRGHFVRSQVKFLYESALNLQAFAKIKLHTVRFERVVQKIKFIQNWYRSYHILSDFSNLFGSTIPGFDYNNRRKRMFEYLQRERSALSLLVFPLRLYQAQFYYSRLSELKSQTTTIARMQIKRNTSDIYGKTWSWPFLQILHHRANISFNTLRSTTTKLNGISLSSLMGRTRLPDSLMLDLDRHKVSIAYSCLTQLPPMLQLKGISVGGHHTLIMLSEFRVSEIGTSNMKRSIQADHQQQTYEMVTYLYSYGFNDRGQLGHPLRNTRRSCSPDPLLVEPIPLIDTQYSTSSDPITGRLETRLIRSVDYSHSVYAIGTGDDYSVVLIRSGPIFAWGDNHYGQCGIGPKFIRINEPTVIETFRNRAVATISVAPRHSMALLSNGDIYIWGDYHSIGLGTLPAECHFYYPLQVPFKDSSGMPEKCIAIQCGYRFNIALNHDQYVLKLWGNNNVGQLGNNDYLNSQAFPIHILISDIHRTPNAYLRISSISCGARFVAACVIPSRGRLFIWGEFQVVDIPDDVGSTMKTPESLQPSQRLSMTPLTSPRKSLSIPPTPRSKHSVLSTKAICVPTVVISDLWKGFSIVRAICGHSSNVSVILDNGILYGFEMVEPIWFKRDLKSMEKSIEQTIIQPQRSLFDVNSISPRLSSKKLPIKIEPLEGMYHLKPCLFQYRNIRPSTSVAKAFSSTFNNYGCQVDYVTTINRDSGKRDLSEIASITDLQDSRLNVFESLCNSQIVAGVNTCMSLLGETDIQRSQVMDHRFTELLDDSNQHD